MGRLGDALIECGEQKQIAVDTYKSVSNIIRD